MGKPMNLTPPIGDGSTTIFKMGNNLDITHPGTPKIYVDGVLKTVTTDYSITNYTVTFVSAPAAYKLVQGDFATVDRG